MRKLITLFLNLSLLPMAWGQPGNDLCDNALSILLEPPPPCREDGMYSTGISATTEGATASMPQILLSDHFGSGQEFSAPAPDVWFSLAPAGSRLGVQLAGALPDPVLVLFQADDCDEKLPIAFSRGSGKLEAAVEPGRHYLLMVAGAGPSNEGAFNLSIQNYNDCSTCGQRRGILRAWPAPENGRYEAGQTVQFCFEPTLWDPGNSLEWLHSLQIAFGPGWDQSTLQAIPPGACSVPAGQWAWYDNWEGCMSGEAFGPGFAYDSPLGLLCPGGSPMDGDPGNNFGDGPCSSFFAAPLPLQFCWSVQVGNDFSTSEESNLNLEVTMLADGNSGSWMPISCPPAPAARFLATAVPQAALMPAIEAVQQPCVSGCDGVIQLSGNLNSSWSYTLLDESGGVAFSTNAQSGAFTLTGFCPGSYRLNITNDSLGITQSVVYELTPAPFPEIQLDYQATCQAGEPGQILCAVNGAGAGSLAFFWLGPDNFISNEASPEVQLPGAYTLYAFSGSCQGEPLSIDVPRTAPEVACEAGSGQVIFHWTPLPQDTAYELEVLSGHNGSWLSPTAFRVEGLAPSETASIALSAYGAGPCPVAYAEASCEALPCQPSSIAPDTLICPGGQAQLWVSAATNTAISWSPASTLSCADCPAPVAQPSATTTYSAAITDALGCTSVQEVTVSVNSLPPGALPDEPLLFCPGEPFIICLPPENSYLWTSPIGFITTGSCLKFVNPTPGIAGLYRIRVSLPGGCQFTETLRLQLDAGCPPPGGSGPGLQPWALAQSTSGGLEVYPNPAVSQVQVKFPAGGPGKLVLFTAEGRPVLQLQSDEPTLQLPLGQLPAGAYLLQAITAAGVEIVPLAIVR